MPVYKQIWSIQTIFGGSVTTRTPVDGEGWFPGPAVSAGIFTRSVRRDLADLNRQYLELGVTPDACSDPLFGWADDVRTLIAGAGPTIRERMAACPFALFSVCISAGNPVPGTGFLAELDRVEDRPDGGSHGSTRLPGCVAFAHGALFTAWRLAESAPLVGRIAFGLSTVAERELAETGPTRIALLAACPGVVGPRWPAHSRFWAMLRGAAQSGTATSLQWAHCAGICLMDR
jgi:hypothetical protein